LSTELDRVTTHGVALDAHFSKFGYDAHIRSYDDGDSPGGSGATTPRSSVSSGSSGEMSSVKHLKLYKVRLSVTACHRPKANFVQLDSTGPSSTSILPQRLALAS
jgi:hypothetical protein